MSRRALTVDRYQEIERLLATRRGIREITRALKYSRRLVRQIRDGAHRAPDAHRDVVDPLWMAQVDWEGIVRDLGLGHPLKFLWEEKAQSLTMYSNTWTPRRGKHPLSCWQQIEIPAIHSYMDSRAVVQDPECMGSGLDCFRIFGFVVMRARRIEP